MHKKEWTPHLKTYMGNADPSEQIDVSIGQHLVEWSQDLAHISSQCCQNLCAARQEDLTINFFF